MMESAKVFMNGRSQAVRLPKAFRFEGSEVYIKHTPQGVLIVPKEPSVWDTWEASLHEHAEVPFVDGREQGEAQVREGWMSYLIDTNICIYLMKNRPPVLSPDCANLTCPRSKYLPLPSPSCNSASPTASMLSAISVV